MPRPMDRCYNIIFLPSRAFDLTSCPCPNLPSLLVTGVGAGVVVQFHASQRCLIYSEAEMVRVTLRSRDDRAIRVLPRGYASAAMLPLLCRLSSIAKIYDTDAIISQASKPHPPRLV